MNSSRQNLTIGCLVALGVVVYFFVLSHEPYFPSPRVRLLFWTIVPLLIYLFLCRQLFRRVDGKWIISDRGRGIVSHIRLMGVRVKITVLPVFLVAALIGSPAISICLRDLLGYPTKWFATQKLVLTAEVQSRANTSLYYPGYSHLSLRSVDNSIDILWPAEEANRFLKGSCVTIEARSWILGAYVEAINPTKCGSKSASPAEIAESE